MGIAAQLTNHTVLTAPLRQMSAREIEEQKTRQQRAEDVIYTLNHTATCLTLTDLLVVPVLRGFGMNIGHTHSHGGHGHDHHHGHAHAAHGKPILWQRIKSEVSHAFQGVRWKNWKGAGNWLVGEAVGDVVAAPVTIGFQRFAPGFMQGIRAAIEPVVGGFFRRGSERAAHKWADRHGLGYDDQDVVARAQQLYDYEMRHLPQMAVWTVTSIGLHYAMMKGVLEKEITVGNFSRQKAVGAGITAALVFGARALAPDKAHQWDETAGKHVVVPLTKKAGKLFGLKERDVDDYHARRTETNLPKNWIDKIKEPTAPSSLRA